MRTADAKDRASSSRLVRGGLFGAAAGSLVLLASVFALTAFARPDVQVVTWSSKAVHTTATADHVFGTVAIEGEVR
jgi:hypothetical protein